MAAIKCLDGLEIREDASPIEDIISYIHSKKDYQEILKKDSRWEIFYHLSPMRESLFHWLDFDQDAKLLELGCELGALTSLFCRKCKQVTAVDWSDQKVQAVRARNRKYKNLDVFAGDIRDYFSSCAQANRFEYIVLMPAYYGAGLKPVLGSIKNLVKKTGSIFIAVKNKIGIDVMSGKAASGEAPYDAWNCPGSGYYSYMEIKEILRETGFERFRFYYPVPDHILPQEIYSEDNLPDHMHHDRILNYYPCTDTLLLNSGMYMNEVIKNHILRECASSFFVECSAEGTLSSITYAALSADRERKAAYATKIYGKNYVRKSALFEEGRQGIRQLYQNALELEQRGIQTVRQQMEDGGNSLIMPYVSQDTLMQHMKDHCRKQEDFLQIFDKLSQLIIKSSAPADSRQNAMVKYDPEADWGVILQHAYIDMIPLNCFWADGEFIFFDQEFRFDYYPARYVLFRALRYTWLAYCQDGREFDLDFFKKRYHLEQIWQYCLKEEDKFIFQNRNHGLYANFYRWTLLDDEQIRENVQRLCSCRNK